MTSEYSFLAVCVFPGMPQKGHCVCVFYCMPSVLCTSICIFSYNTVCQIRYDQKVVQILSVVKFNLWLFYCVLKDMYVCGCVCAWHVKGC